MLVCNVKWIFLCSWHAIHQFIYFYLISFAFRNAWIGFTCVEEMKNKKSPLNIWRSFTTNMKVGSSTGHCGRVCWMVPWGWKKSLWGCSIVLFPPVKFQLFLWYVNLNCRHTSISVSLAAVSFQHVHYCLDVQCAPSSLHAEFWAAEASAELSLIQCSVIQLGAEGAECPGITDVSQEPRCRFRIPGSNL